MSHKYEALPKVFHVEKLIVISHQASEPPSQLVCFPEEADELRHFVGKKVRVRSIFELVDPEEE